MSESEARRTNPDNGPEKRYTGIQGFDVTTAGNLFDPRLTFWLTNELNKGKPESEWVGIEVYAAIDRPFLSTLGRKLKKLPKGVTAQEVWDWQKEFPNTIVTRVHPAFSATKFEAIHRIFLGELGNGIDQHLYQAAWLIGFGAANNMHGVNLTADLRSQGQKAIMNAHANVIKGFAESGLLPEVQSKAGELLAENERKFNSPIVDDQRVIYDPRVIVSQILEKYQEVDGLLLGYDHGEQHGVNMIALMNDESITKNVYAMHLADTNSVGSHDTIKIGDEKVGKFIAKVAETKFVHPIRAAFDYNPMSFGRMSPQDQLRLIRQTIDWIKNIQSGNGDISPRILRFRPLVSAPRPLEATA